MHPTTGSIRFSSRISRSLGRSRVRKLLGFRKSWASSQNLTRQAVRILAKLKESGNWITAGLVGCLALLFSLFCSNLLFISEFMDNIEPGYYKPSQSWASIGTIPCRQ